MRTRERDGELTLIPVIITSIIGLALIATIVILSIIGA